MCIILVLYITTAAKKLRIILRVVIRSSPLHNSLRLLLATGDKMFTQWITNIFTARINNITSH